MSTNALSLYVSHQKPPIHIPGLLGAQIDSAGRKILFFNTPTDLQDFQRIVGSELPNKIATPELLQSVELRQSLHAIVIDGLTPPPTPQTTQDVEKIGPVALQGLTETIMKAYTTGLAALRR